MPVVTLSVGTRMLNISMSKARRKIAAGAPVARQGRRGRGCSTLIDVDVWRTLEGGPAAPAADSTAIRIIAAQLPAVIAGAIESAFRDAVDRKSRTGTGLPAADVAFVLAGVWYDVSHAVRDHMAKSIPDLAEEIPIPPALERLRQISQP